MDAAQNLRIEELLRKFVAELTRLNLLFSEISNPLVGALMYKLLGKATKNGI